MSNLRIGVIGMGNMGTTHAQSLARGQVPGAELTAVFDIDPHRLKRFMEHAGPNVAAFESREAFFASGRMDAVLIATPHYDHCEWAIAAFGRGLHVLVEKPAGVHTRQVRAMNAAAAESGRVFSIMYNQRTHPVYRKLRDLVVSGELGEIRRTIWIIDWYRPQSYYDSGDWRATWAGEGGGVLLNQDPHQLDLWQWTIDRMPKRVRAFCGFGKYHRIEVEDEATAYVEYENGATGLFVTSTGQAPGTNRLEISADRGKVVIEDGKLVFWRNRVPERQFNREHTGGFGKPECWRCEIPVEGEETGHVGIIANWTEAILKGTPLLAPGEDGIKGLMLSNAMYLSAWTDAWVDLPIDEDRFCEALQEKIDRSAYRRKEAL